MKKYLAIGLCGLLAAAMLTGCSQKKVTPSQTDGTVTLGEYKGIKYTPASTEVTDEDVDAAIQNMLDAYPTKTSVNRPAKLGDTVNIDYVGLLDGVAFDGGTASGYDLSLGSGTFIDGFEDGLVGVSTGDQVDLDLTFPENYGAADLAGQAVVFQVTVNDVFEMVPAKLTDEFVASYTDYVSVDEYRAATREALEQAAVESAQAQMEYDIFNTVLNNAQVSLSDEQVDAYYEELYDVYEQQAESFGMDVETMVGYFGMDLETFQNELRAESVLAAERQAVIDAIASKENIKIEDADLEKLAEDFGYDSVDEMIEDAGENTVNIYILTDKVVAFLVENAVAE